LPHGYPFVFSKSNRETKSEVNLSISFIINKLYNQLQQQTSDQFEVFRAA
jgi:hypothetical protein